ncbi:capsid cement protein [Acidovorax sp. SUPP2825]|uniref:capsid cement protein n=1 Tax=Acidovorax sp. SUPP2825 TaxID=2920879 RepID=UPI0023DE68F7|nr:capsid cement protein [Acidovorax sp. SUPP2825]GKS96944.1 DUF2190 family protein [Acidovorax sp. SUPP2825]
MSHSGNIAILTLTVAAAGPLAANRVITQAGGYPAAGGKAFAVTRTSAELAGDLVPVDVIGTTIAETGAAIAFDADLMSDAQGRVVPLTVGAKYPVARAMQSAAAAGGFIEILLLQSAVPSAAA